MASTAPPSHTTILGLLEHSAYNPGIVPQLEAYVDAQLSAAAPYSFEANRTLLKLYQFFPHLADEGYIASTLFLSLIEFPSTDCTSICCLIPEKVQSREPCASLIRCADLLETCQFSQFWPIFHQLSGTHASLSSASSSPSTVRKLRRSILSLLSLVYKTAPLVVVLSALELTSSFALKDFLNEDGNEHVADLVAEVKEGECVDFRPRPENTRRTRVFKEGVNFDSVANVLAKTYLARE